MLSRQVPPAAACARDAGSRSSPSTIASVAATSLGAAGEHDVETREPSARAPALATIERPRTFLEVGAPGPEVQHHVRNVERRAIAVGQSRSAAPSIDGTPSAASRRRSFSISCAAPVIDHDVVSVVTVLARRAKPDRGARTGKRASTASKRRHGAEVDEHVAAAGRGSAAPRPTPGGPGARRSRPARSTGVAKRGVVGGHEQHDPGVGTGGAQVGEHAGGHARCRRSRR